MKRATLYRKVPEITPWFWVLKLITTALGEAFSDYLVQAIDPVVAVVCGALAFFVALVIQLHTTRYHPFSYWVTVLMVAIFGTMVADVIHVGFGVPYAASSIVFGAAAAGLFVSWRRVEGSLSIHSITSMRRELLYWSAVAVTFALGTAVGDLAASSFGLGYGGSIILFAVLIAIPFVGRLRYKWSDVGTFWWAYILTRPLGASVADFSGKPRAMGGLGVGDLLVSVMLFALFIIVVRLKGSAHPKRLA